jgi:hypothetical protein
MGNTNCCRSGETGRVERNREALLETTLEIGKMGKYANGLFDNARSFVKLSQGNASVQEVALYLYKDYRFGYEGLRVLEKAIDNLEALQRLTIRCLQFDEYDDQVAISR